MKRFRGRPCPPHDFQARRFSPAPWAHRPPWRWASLSQRRIAHFVNARLHRRLFVGLGVAVLASVAVTAIAHRVMAPRALSPVTSFLISAATLWFVAGVVSHRLTRPLVDLVEVTRDLGAGQLGRRMRRGRSAPGEIGIIARAINDMAERIEKQMTDQRELLAAVSHELRTPLGHVRVLIDTARQRMNDHPSLVEIEREVLEIDRLVDQLLATSRVDFGQLKPRDVDATDLAIRALERADVDASCLQTEGPAGFRGDPSLLLAALTNLVENAKQHGGGVSGLKIHASASEVCFEVTDGGPGFEPGTEERVFESFYRGERRAGGSLGLGLALVQRIAHAHGGRAWAKNIEPSGACVGLAVPRTGPPTSGSKSH